MVAVIVRDEPDLDPAAVAAGLRVSYGLDVASLTFLPLGFDMSAAVYRVDAEDGAAYFLKTRTGPVHETGLRVARALADAGIEPVVAPIPTRSGDLRCRLGDRDAILYTFVAGESAMDAGLSDQQWLAFGRAMRAVHDVDLPARLRDELPSETFDLPSAALVREMTAHAEGASHDGPAAARLTRLWADHADRIDAALRHAEALGRRLRAKPFELVPCHADIHAANILRGAGDDGPIHLVDWDGPKLAPRERDLLFVVGSTIARPVEPREEALFFQGNGSIEIDPEALTYYRYERFVEDLGEIGRSVLLDPTPSETVRRAEVDIAAAYLTPGGFLDRAETVVRHRW